MAKDDIYILTQQGSFGNPGDHHFGAPGQLVRQVDEDFGWGDASFVILCPRQGQCKTSFSTETKRMKPLQGGSEH